MNFIIAFCLFHASNVLFLSIISVSIKVAHVKEEYKIFFTVLPFIQNDFKKLSLMITKVERFIYFLWKVHPEKFV